MDVKVSPINFTVVTIKDTTESLILEIGLTSAKKVLAYHIARTFFKTTESGKLLRFKSRNKKTNPTLARKN